MVGRPAQKVKPASPKAPARNPPKVSQSIKKALYDLGAYAPFEYSGFQTGSQFFAVTEFILGLSGEVVNSFPQFGSNGVGCGFRVKVI